jgi:hypothetical protein
LFTREKGEAEMPFSDINANPPFPSSSYFMMNYLLRIDHEVEFAQPETELSASERSFSQHRSVIIPVLLSAFRVRLMAEARIFFPLFSPGNTQNYDKIICLDRIIITRANHLNLNKSLMASVHKKKP